KRAVAALGFESEVFLDRPEGPWPAPVRPLAELRPGTQDLLLVHHWAYQDRLDWLTRLRCRKALIYHGITPPRYLAHDNRERHRSVRAYAQLEILRNICEASIALTPTAAEELRYRGFQHVSPFTYAKDWSSLRFLDAVEPDAIRRPQGCRL